MVNKKSYFATMALAFASLFLMGFLHSCWSNLSGKQTFDPLATDDDAVFDLFQDDFGTGTEYDDRFTVSPTVVKKKHIKGKTECPQKLETITFSDGWEILNEDDLAKWLSFARTSGTADDPLEISFPCFGFEEGVNKAEIKVTNGVAIDTIGVELTVE